MRLPEQTTRPTQNSPSYAGLSGTESDTSTSGYIPLGFPERTGATSTKEIVITQPARYNPGLQSLYVQLPSHFYKLAIGLSEKELDTSRRQIASQHAAEEWQTVAAYALSVYRHKAASLRGKPTEAAFMGELDKIKQQYILIHRWG